MVTILDYNEFKKKALSNPKVKAEYDALESEFAHFDELLKIGKSHTSENRRTKYIKYILRFITNMVIWNGK